VQNRLSKLINTKAENTINASRVNFSFLPGAADFPLVISPKAPGLILNEWIKENRETFDSKLKKHGAILLRGFNISTVEKFQDFISGFDDTPLEYRQRSSPRFEVAKNIYHSTTYPADQQIHMHSENSYSYKWPMKIIFCCIQPAEEQGETPIADNRQVIRNLSATTRDKFTRYGVKYVRNVSKGIGLSWQEVFQTSDRTAVEAECTGNGMNFKWEGEDKLVLSWDNKAVYAHPDTGEEIWFNHSAFFNKYSHTDEVLSSFGADDELPFNTYFGNGTPITKEEVEEIRQAYKKASVIFPWVKGDVLFMDNMLVAHGRSPYKGDRKVVVSMF
jgi:alpha-ketoglutarate-dependent taurine dioxygenase